MWSSQIRPTFILVSTLAPVAPPPPTTTTHWPTNIHTISTHPATTKSFSDPQPHTLNINTPIHNIIFLQIYTGRQPASQPANHPPTVVANNHRVVVAQIIHPCSTEMENEIVIFQSDRPNGASDPKQEQDDEKDDPPALPRVLLSFRSFCVASMSVQVFKFKHTDDIYRFRLRNICAK